jgi:hypothetical protein
VKLLVERLERGPLRVFSSDQTPNGLVMEGVLREPDPAAWLCPLIDSVHTRAARDGLAEVVLDLRALEYANAAAWKCIVYWVRLLGDGSKYRLRILTDQKHRWQQVGMTALRVFAQQRLEITEYRAGRLA